ncbi:MAG: GGDEF domain-containing protein [Sulfurimonas sp.]|nr:GGDEF domain-containing protein [Sulfurimonas sp.]
MLLPETKEREYRFKLALRMVLPIFALVLALILHTSITSDNALSNPFYVESILILIFSIYFIFFLIYRGFDTKITNDISKVFTREYLYKYLQKELNNSKEYTLILISINNLSEINKRYGIKNGDKVLYETSRWIGEYLKEKDIKNFPIGHVKGGDFIIGLKGNKSNYKTIMELMCLKSEDLKIDDIEVQMSVAINDKVLSKDVNYLIENLFELQNKNSKFMANIEDEMDPSELESYVINAINERNLLFMTQNVFEQSTSVIKECFIRLETKNGKILHQKSYIKILDKFRLMIDYDLMVIEKIMGRCNDSSSEMYAISVSPTSIRNPLFFRSIKDFFTKNKNAKNRIIFLLSENEYYPRIDKYNSTIQALRDLGIIIGVDRLGSIHTSFLYLRDLDIDIVRFDSFYTKDINEGKYKNIIDGFNIMAHEKNVKTWIKMVENEDVNNIARELNIDYSQGKYLAPLEKN